MTLAWGRKRTLSTGKTGLRILSAVAALGLAILGLYAYGTSASAFSAEPQGLEGIARRVVAGFEAFGILTTVALAAITTGLLLGFLFAIPRATYGNGADQGGDDIRYEVNTNLVEISDWLTKGLTALALVELANLRTYVQAFSGWIGGALDAGSGGIISTIAATFYLALGFLFGYLWVRLFLQGAFRRSDDQLGELAERLDKSEKEVLALVLVDQQLQSIGGIEDPVDPKELQSAITDASPSTQRSIYYLAREQRRRRSRAGNLDATAADRLALILRALVESDIHFAQADTRAQLGYLYKDVVDLAGEDAVQAWEESIRWLTQAIRIRGDTKGNGLYEFNRALARARLIEADPSRPDARQDEVCRDLQQARQDPSWSAWEQQLQANVIMRPYLTKCADGKSSPSRAAAA